MAVAFTRSDRPGNEEATLFYGNERDAHAVAIKEELKLDQESSSSRSLFAWESRSLVRRRILQVVIATVGLGIIIAIICAFALNVKYHGYTSLGKARFKLDDRFKIEFKNAANKFVLSGEIGLLVRASSLTRRHSKKRLTYKYATKDGITLVLTQESDFSFIVNWTSPSAKPTVFKDCLSIENSHWYGGSELLWQKWPLGKVSVNMGQYVPKDSIQLQNKSTDTAFGSVLARYWLSSSGVAVLVDASVPLHLSINSKGDKKLCLKSDTSGYLSPAVSRLTYRILSGNDVKSLHIKAINQYLGKPKRVPPVDIIKSPTWVTDRNSPIISQNEIETLGKFIQHEMPPCNSIVIHGEYSKVSGNYNFDPVRFPDVKTMVKILAEWSCNVSVAVQPLVKIGTQEFDEANQLGYLLQDCGGKVPGLVKWQGDLAATLDMTIWKNKAWFKKKLESFRQEYGFASFEFNSGSTTHLPFCYQFRNHSMDPGNFAQHYAEFASELKGISIGVGYNTQKLPIFVKMADKDSSWNDSTGLKSLIPTILTFGIMGYSYVLPSVIGGRQGRAEKELYIRWLQASIFFPSIQFLKVPWDYDKETVEITQNLLKLRFTLNPVILEAFYNVTKTGSPVIRPIWWISPSDHVALTIDSQFMLGDHYLVAPVLEKGQSRKSVYLPVGQWKDKFTKEQKIIDNRKVGSWVEYNVTLRDLPYFKCLTLYN